MVLNLSHVHVVFGHMWFLVTCGLDQVTCGLDQSHVMWFWVGHGFLAVPFEISPGDGFSRRGTLSKRGGVDISATLCMSPCSSDYIFSNKLSVGIWHTVSEDFSRDFESVTARAEAPSVAAVTARLKPCPTQNLPTNLSC